MFPGRFELPTTAPSRRCLCHLGYENRTPRSPLVISGTWTRGSWGDSLRGLSSFYPRRGYRALDKPPHRAMCLLVAWSCGDSNPGPGACRVRLWCTRRYQTSPMCAPCQGFEPQPPGPEPSVLPLDEQGMTWEPERAVHRKAARASSSPWDYPDLSGPAMRLIGASWPRLGQPA